MVLKKERIMTRRPWKPKTQKIIVGSTGRTFSRQNLPKHWSSREDAESRAKLTKEIDLMIEIKSRFCWCYGGL